MIVETYTDIRPAIEQAGALPFAFIREYSRVVIGAMPQPFDEEQVIEARFFGEGQEIRLFRNDEGALCAARLIAEETDVYIEHTHTLTNPKLFGEKLVTREYLTADEDGQMIVDQVCMTSWTGGATHG